MIVQTPRLSIEIPDKRIDVVFAARAVEMALVKRGAQALAKSIGLLLDATNDSFDLFVVETVRLSRRLARDSTADCDQRQEAQRQIEANGFCFHLGLRIHYKKSPWLTD
jgi:hypothetical protein